MQIFKRTLASLCLLSTLSVLTTRRVEATTNTANALGGQTSCRFLINRQVANDRNGQMMPVLWSGQLYSAAGVNDFVVEDQFGFLSFAMVLSIWNNNGTANGGTTLPYKDVSFMLNLVNQRTLPALERLGGACPASTADNNCINQMYGANATVTCASQLSSCGKLADMKRFADNFKAALQRWERSPASAQDIFQNFTRPMTKVPNVWQINYTDTAFNRMQNQQLCGATANSFLGTVACTYSPDGQNRGSQMCAGSMQYVEKTQGTQLATRPGASQDG